MFTDADSNEDTKFTSLLANLTDDSCRLEYIEIVPLSRSTLGPCTTDRDSGDLSAQVKQENVTFVKQEPHDVCYGFFVIYLVQPHWQIIQPGVGLTGPV